MLSPSVMSDSFASPWTVAYWAPLSMGYSRQEYGSGLPFLYPRDLPDPAIQLLTPALAGEFFTTKPPRKTQNTNCSEIKHGFCLLFHTLCTDQVLFPTATDYIFHNKSSITFPLAQGRQA